MTLLSIYSFHLWHASGSLDIVLLINWNEATYVVV